MRLTESPRAMIFLSLDFIFSWEVNISLLRLSPPTRPVLPSFSLFLHVTQTHAHTHTQVHTHMHPVSFKSLDKWLCGFSYTHEPWSLTLACIRVCLGFKGKAPSPICLRSTCHWLGHGGMANTQGLRPQDLYWNLRRVRRSTSLETLEKDPLSPFLD